MKLIGRLRNLIIPTQYTGSFSVFEQPVAAVRALGGYVSTTKPWRSRKRRKKNGRPIRPRLRCQRVCTPRRPPAHVRGALVRGSRPPLPSDAWRSAAAPEPATPPSPPVSRRRSPGRASRGGFASARRRDGAAAGHFLASRPVSRRGGGVRTSRAASRFGTRHPPLRLFPGARLAHPPLATGGRAVGAARRPRRLPAAGRAPLGTRQPPCATTPPPPSTATSSPRGRQWVGAAAVAFGDDADMASVGRGLDGRGGGREVGDGRGAAAS